MCGVWQRSRSWVVAWLAGVSMAAMAQTPRGIEMDSLIQLVLIPTGASYNVGDWRAGADAKSPINWLHAGIEEAGQRGKMDHGTEYSFVRRGEAVVLMNRQPSHEVLGRRVEPGKWNVQLLGARAGTGALKLSPQTGSHDMPHVLDYLRKRGVALKHLKCFKEAASDGVEVHRMTMKGFQPTYVVYGWSYGSGGGTQDLLVTSDAAVMQTQCWGD